MFFNTKFNAAPSRTLAVRALEYVCARLNICSAPAPAPVPSRPSRGSLPVNTSAMSNTQQFIINALVGYQQHRNEPRMPECFSSWEALSKQLAMFEAAQPFVLTADQQHALDKARQYPLVLLVGPAQSGKRLAAHFFADFLRSHGAEIYQAEGAAGVAFQVRYWYSERLHSMSVVRGSSDARARLLLLDEGSFTDLEKLQELLFETPYETRIVITCDMEKLPSDAARQIIECLHKAPGVSVASFSTVLRQCAVLQ